MKPQMIVMLTNNDVTVSNARDYFLSAADLPVQYWGFKDVGLRSADMEKLVADFREAGKTPVLEIVRFEEQDVLNAVALAVSCGAEYVTGATFRQTAMERAHTAGIKYYPFCGRVGGSPIKLAGTTDDIVNDAKRLHDLGSDGVDLVAYRYSSGDPLELAKQVVHELGGERVIIAGSINSAGRIKIMHEIGPFGYTIGSALFEGGVKPGTAFRDNLERVVDVDAAFSRGER